MWQSFGQERNGRGQALLGDMASYATMSDISMIYLLSHIFNHLILYYIVK